MINYFKLFGLPAQYDVDTKQLTQTFRELMQQNHPDKFAIADEQTRLAAMQNASTLNEGLNVLQDAIARTAHLLELAGVKIDLNNPPNQESMFLMQQMELREALTEATSFKDLTVLETQANALFADTENHIKIALQNQVYDDVAVALAKLQFIIKLQQEIKTAEERLD